MLKKVIGIVLSCVVLLEGCGPQTPMQKLASDKLFQELDNPFWLNEQKAKTPLWTEAVEYCQKHGGMPNCESLMLVYVISNGSTEVPAYGTSGNYLKVPKF
jgi:hypothetical protein